MGGLGDDGVLGYSGMRSWSTLGMELGLLLCLVVRGQRGEGGWSG